MVVEAKLHFKLPPEPAKRIAFVAPIFTIFTRLVSPLAVKQDPKALEVEGKVIVETAAAFITHTLLSHNSAAATVLVELYVVTAPVSINETILVVELNVHGLAAIPVGATRWITPLASACNKA